MGEPLSERYNNPLAEEAYRDGYREGREAATKDALKLFEAFNKNELRSIESLRTELAKDPKP